LAVTVAESIQVIGVLLVFALLIAPAATAHHLTKQPLYGILLSIILGVAFTWGGLLLALVSRFPISFYIASVAGLTYFITVSISHRLTPHKPAQVAHHHT
jgi:zinc/manganese transport system permease protein